MININNILIYAYNITQFLVTHNYYKVLIKEIY